MLPLFAFFVERRRRGQARPVWAAAVVWLGLGVVTLVQALRGQPLLAPDAITAVSALVVVGAGAGRHVGPSRHWPRRLGAAAA